MKIYLFIFALALLTSCGGDKKDETGEGSETQTPPEEGFQEPAEGSQESEEVASQEPGEEGSQESEEVGSQETGEEGSQESEEVASQEDSEMGPEPEVASEPEPEVVSQEPVPQPEVASQEPAPQPRPEVAPQPEPVVESDSQPLYVYNDTEIPVVVTVLPDGGNEVEVEVLSKECLLLADDQGYLSGILRVIAVSEEDIVVCENSCEYRSNRDLLLVKNPPLWKLWATTPVLSNGVLAKSSEVVKTACQ